jgi:multiple sugar transport system permease protein/sn-glycerol 3-phosphate transport system permease protein
MSAGAAPSASHRRLGQERQRALTRALAYLLLTAGAIIIMIPFFWMISTSLKKQWDVYQFPPVWIPNPPQWQNYSQALTTYPFHLYMLNTLRVVVFANLGTLLCSLAAYGSAAARPAAIIFILLLATMMLPYTVTMIPIFMVFNRLHWVDTFAAHRAGLLRQRLLHLPAAPVLPPSRASWKTPRA